MNSPTGADTVYSPDGKWMWTGQDWVSAPPRSGVPPSAPALGPPIVGVLNIARTPPSRPNAGRLSGPNPVFIAGGVLFVGLLAALGIGLVVDAGGVHGSSAEAPAVADAEAACRTAFRTAYEQDDQAVKARYAREEPNFTYLTAMNDVNIWTSIPTASAVEVTGDVEWTLTTYRLGPQSQKTPLNCTATVEEGQIVTSVHNP